MLIVSGATTWAQPPEKATVEAGKPKPFDADLQMATMLANETPAEMAVLIVSRFGWGDLKTAAFGVAGADSNAPELAQLQTMISLLENRTRWNATYDREKSVAIPDGATEIAVKVRVGVYDELALQFWRDEEVQLRGETIRGKKIWRVVPEKPETIFTTVFEQSPDVGIVRRIATYLAFPRQAAQWLGLPISQSQAKQLSLGVMQLLQKAGGKYQFDPENFKEKITPYLRNANLLTAPGDAAGQQSFGFNPYLSGKKLADIEESAQTVLLYLGRDEKLDFRYNGKTIVAFADGHIEAIDAERAKTLRWKP